MKTEDLLHRFVCVVVVVVVVVVGLNCEEEEGRAAAFSRRSARVRSTRAAASYLSPHFLLFTGPLLPLLLQAIYEGWAI